MRKALTILLLAISPVFPLLAQENPPPLEGGLVGVDLMLVYPRGAFAENIDNAGLGLSADLAYAPPWLPVVMGLTGSYAFYGTTDLSVPYTWMGRPIIVDMTATNKIVTTHLFLRIQPQDGDFRPFFEGLMGMNILWTNSSVDDEEDEELGISGDTFLSDVAFSYGAGGGVDICVSKGANDESDTYGELYISARIRYLYGGEAEYLDAESISFDEHGVPGVAPEDRMKSSTDMMQILLGITVRL